MFCVRLTPEQEQRLDEQREALRGPRGKGPWLLWRALECDAGGVVPGPSSGNTGARLVAGMGTTRAAFRSLRATALASRGGITPPGRVPVVVDLCAGSGAWSAPYAAAGYDVVRVTLPERDVLSWAPPTRLLEHGVRGVLAAPPCDQFSLARNGAPTPRDLAKGLGVVAACLRIIALCRPAWWALENPVGLLGHYLGTPSWVFDPCDYGDPWTKRTALWGSFGEPLRGPFVEPSFGGGHPCTKTGRPCSHAACRAITPPGFARAFFEANP